jgi:hypothetical protein
MSVADELKKLKELMDDELITREEFDSQKRILLANSETHGTDELQEDMPERKPRLTKTEQDYKLRCPVCGSMNVTAQPVQNIYTRNRGCLGWLGWILLSIITCCIFLLIALVTSQKVQSTTTTEAVCQNCGKRWQLDAKIKWNVILSVVIGIVIWFNLLIAPVLNANGNGATRACKANVRTLDGTIVMCSAEYDIPVSQINLAFNSDNSVSLIDSLNNNVVDTNIIGSSSDDYMLKWPSCEGYYYQVVNGVVMNQCSHLRSQSMPTNAGTTPEIKAPLTDSSTLTKPQTDDTVIDEQLNSINGGDINNGLFVVRANGGLNMRSGAGQTFTIVTVIPDGSLVASSNKNGEWLFVEYNGESGWINESYTIKLDKVMAAARNTQHYDERLQVFMYVLLKDDLEGYIKGANTLFSETWAEHYYGDVEGTISDIMNVFINNDEAKMYFEYLFYTYNNGFTSQGQLLKYQSYFEPLGFYPEPYEVK